MEDKILKLNNTRIYVVRSIHPYTRTVTDEELAKKGIGIGNDWDSDTDHAAYQWKMVDHYGSGMGVMSREYNMPVGKWSVYLAKDLEHAKNKFLKEKKKEGDVLYIAEIDLIKVKLGKNLPFEYMEKDENGKLKYAETALEIDSDNEAGEYHLVSQRSLETLQAGLKCGFDSTGRLKDDGNLFGEFYLDNYKDPSQIEKEYIFRVKEGEHVEITSEIKRLRGEMESQKERLSSFKLR
ncbi:MAG: hypothetical protein IPK84_03480 [Candidatus Moraniibacteriota bacterium]|nr:MAG: hypothetical protein IPK84_03480 [Candidatus Moranbacteria bacterium]